jgi:hypothetical protein
MWNAALGFLQPTMTSVDEAEEEPPPVEGPATCIGFKETEEP